MLLAVLFLNAIHLKLWILEGRVLRFEIKTKWWLTCPADQNWLGKLILDHVETQKQKVRAINAIFEEDLFIFVRHVTGTDQDYLGESPECLVRYLLLL